MPDAEELSEHETLAVAFAVRTTGVDGQVALSPVVGVTVELRLTLPAKLFTLDRTTVKGRFVTPVLKLTWPWAET